ncbi:ATP-binding protein [Sphingomonas sp. Tas61C01]|uniref:ATP-binding protein n=1 Tax=Sphingomonas sp. Tas61C01 TaxID=3458297 RepID=UPI00403E889E
MNWAALSDLGRRHPVYSIALSMALACAAIAGRLAFDPMLGGYPLLTFFPAILLATLFGGRNGGIVCASLSTLFAWYFLIEPRYSLAVAWPGGLLRLLAFGTLCALIVAVIDGMARAFDRAQKSDAARAALNAELEERVIARTAELRNANERLTSEIAQRTAAEEQVRQMQRLEAIGQLTGGIAHDFNNMLSIIMGNLSLASRRIAAGNPDVLRYLDSANEGAARAATLTQRLLAFGRRQPLEPAVVDVNRLVGGMTDMIRRTLGEEIQIETILAGGLWMTHADPGQLENAIVNLAINARDAMADGGKLTLETQNAHLDEAYVAGENGLEAGQYVMLAVSDTGSGMSAEVAARAFEPFFTTKEVGKGTGLGLSQIYGFTKQTGGHLRIYSEPAHGTTIRLYLPRHHGAVGPVAATLARETLPCGSRDELILVVEDEASVRATSVETLRELGYSVAEAADGDSALALLATLPAVALLFTDVVMPGMTGGALAQEATRRRPGLKTLFTTGYTRNSIVHGGMLDPGVQLLQKPFTADQLARKIRQVIAR